MAKPLKIASEDSILNLLGKYFPLSHPSLILGRGDDCALLKGGNPLSVSTDLFLEDVHFRRSYFTAEEIGHKALACNISDLAACGTRPKVFTLCLGLPSDIDATWLEEFFSGMGSLAAKYGMGLAGGDISASDKLSIAVTVFGEPVGEDGFLSRGGSVPGDTIFVVGSVGLARIGLLEMEAHGREAMERYPKACLAHLKPEPMVDAGLMRARAGRNARPPALMDLSDGIARDLPRLLGLTGELGTASTIGGQGIGAELLLPAGLLHAELVQWCRENGRNPVHEAFFGGEEYALLGACAPDMLLSLHAAIPGFWEIGSVTDRPGIYCNNERMDGMGGFDHFAEAGGGARQ